MAGISQQLRPRGTYQAGELLRAVDMRSLSRELQRQGNQAVAPPLVSTGVGGALLGIQGVNSLLLPFFSEINQLDGEQIVIGPTREDDEYIHKDFIYWPDSENGFSKLLFRPQIETITIDEALMYVYYDLSKDTGTGIITAVLKADSTFPDETHPDFTDEFRVYLMGVAEFDAAIPAITRWDPEHPGGHIYVTLLGGDGGGDETCTNGELVTEYIKDVFVVAGTPDILKKIRVVQTETYVNGLHCEIERVETLQEIGEWCCPETVPSCNAPCDPICVDGAGTSDVDGQYAFTGFGATCCEWTKLGFKIEKNAANDKLVLTTAGVVLYESELIVEGTCPCPSTLAWTTAIGAAPPPSVTSGACPSPSVSPSGSACGGRYLNWELNELFGATVAVDSIDSNPGTITGGIIGGGSFTADGVDDELVVVLCEPITANYKVTILMAFPDGNANGDRLFRVHGIEIYWNNNAKELVLNSGGGVSPGDKCSLTGNDYSGGGLNTMIATRTGTNFKLTVNGNLEFDETLSSAQQVDFIVVCSNAGSEFFQCTVNSVNVIE